MAYLEYSASQKAVVGGRFFDLKESRSDGPAFAVRMMGHLYEEFRSVVVDDNQPSFVHFHNH